MKVVSEIYIQIKSKLVLTTLGTRRKESFSIDLFYIRTAYMVEFEGRCTDALISER